MSFRLNLRISMTKLRDVALVAGLVAGLACAATQTWAQTPSAAQAWPQRPVKFIVTLGPGSGADIGARLVADRLAARWGKPVVIENRPGAGGLVAIQAFVNAADDHTLLFTPAGSFTVHPLQYAKLPYVPDDLVPIARVSNTIIAVGVPTSLKIAAGGLRQAGAGRARQAQCRVVSGITEFTFDYSSRPPGSASPRSRIATSCAATDCRKAACGGDDVLHAILQPHALSGRVKVIAVTGHERTSILPDIPTANESGFPALEVEGLVGLFGPRGISRELRERIGADVAAVAADPTIAERLAATAQVPNPGGPAEFAAAIDRQRAQIAVIAQALGTTPER